MESLLVSSLIGLLSIITSFAEASIGGVTPIGWRITTGLGCTDVENGDHELRFMLRCLRTPIFPAARIAAWPFSNPAVCPLIWLLLLTLEALKGGALGWDESEVGENKKDETESLGEHGFDSEEPHDESE